MRDSAIKVHLPILEWFSYIKSATPDSLQYYLDDSFEKITLYSNKTNAVTYKKLANGTFEVKLEIESAKNHYDGNGKLLSSSTKSNLLDIGIFEKDILNKSGMTIKSPLFLRKVWVKPGKSTLTFITTKIPFKAGIDPYNKMIDRVPDDNMKDVEVQ